NAHLAARQARDLDTVPVGIAQRTLDPHRARSPRLIRAPDLRTSHVYPHSSVTSDSPGADDRRRSRSSVPTVKYTAIPAGVRYVPHPRPRAATSHRPGPAAAVATAAAGTTGSARHVSSTSTRSRPAGHRRARVIVAPSPRAIAVVTRSLASSTATS